MYLMECIYWCVLIGVYLLVCVRWHVFISVCLFDRVYLLRLLLLCFEWVPGLFEWCIITLQNIDNCYCFIRDYSRYLLVLLLFIYCLL